MSRLKTVGSRIATVDTSRVNQIGNVDSWRADKTSSTKRGYGYKWQQARSAFLRSNPLCVYCQAAGRVTAATVVDHIIPHRGDMSIFWDKNNWQPLCKHCHDSVKQKAEAGGG